MIQKLNDLCNTKNLQDMIEAKRELMISAKEYLDHTTLGRASKLHPNAETRRLCAFSILYRTDKSVYDEYEANANELRKGEDRRSCLQRKSMSG